MVWKSCKVWAGPPTPEAELPEEGVRIPHIHNNQYAELADDGEIMMKANTENDYEITGLENDYEITGVSNANKITEMENDDKRTGVKPEP